MRKLVVLLLSLLVGGSIFQACDNTKTYAEMLEDEKNAVNAFIKKRGIKVISVEDFEKDTITDVASNEYVLFSNGVYMQIVDRGSKNPESVFKNNNEIISRFMEVDIMEDDTTLASNVHNPYEVLNIYPEGFRYTSSGTTLYGQFMTNEAGLGSNMVNLYGSTAVPSGWLVPLKYVRDSAAVKLIVPSKMGHSTAQQYVYPYFYDIRRFTIY